MKVILSLYIPANDNIYEVGKNNVTSIWETETQISTNEKATFFKVYQKPNTFTLISKSVPHICDYVDTEEVDNY